MPAGSLGGVARIGIVAADAAHARVKLSARPVSKRHAGTVLVHARRQRLSFGLEAQAFGVEVVWSMSAFPPKPPPARMTPFAASTFTYVPSDFSPRVPSPHPRRRS